MTKKLTIEQIEQLALEIVDFLIEYRLWVDVIICFNNSAYMTEDLETEQFYYNDREHLVRVNNVNPDRYIENPNHEHILSISYDSRLYEVLHYGVYEIDDGVVKTLHECDDFVTDLQNQFDDIFTKYGIDYYLCENGKINCCYKET